MKRLLGYISVGLLVILCICMVLQVGYENYESEQNRKTEKSESKNIVEAEETFDERFTKLKERNKKEYERRLKEENNSFYIENPEWVFTTKEDLAEIGVYVEVGQYNPFSHKVEKVGVCVKDISYISETSGLFEKLNDFTELKENEQWVVLDLEVDLREFSRNDTGFEYDFSSIQVKYSDDFSYFSRTYLLKDNIDIVMPEEDFGICRVALKIRKDKEIDSLKIGSISENIGYVKFI